MSQTSNNASLLPFEGAGGQELIQPANRLNSVSEYYFSKKLREIDEMRAQGKDVLNLGIGNPDLPPS